MLKRPKINKKPRERKHLAKSKMQKTFQKRRKVAEDKEISNERKHRFNRKRRMFKIKLSNKYYP